ncbi:MAG: hypothetical protein V1913_05465 [Fibrobacterota bacterium]
MRFSAFTACALICAGLFTACTDDRPVKPSDDPQIDLRALPAARAGLQGAAALLGGFFHAEETVRDSADFRFHYSRVFIDSVRLNDFINEWNTHGRTFNDSTYFPDTSAYGTRYPTYWGFDSSTMIYQILQVRDGIDTSEYIVDNRYPEVYGDFLNQGANGAMVSYRGDFNPSNNYNATALRTFIFSVRLYPGNVTCDSADYELKTFLPDTPLVQEAYPDSGYLLKDYYLLAYDAALLLPQFSGALSPSITRSREAYWFSQKGMHIDSMARIYSRSGDTYRMSRGDSVHAFFLNNANFLNGRQSSDSVSFDSLLSNGWRAEGRRVANDSIHAVVMTNAAGDTLFTVTPGTPVGGLTVVRYSAGHASDTQWYARTGGRFEWTDSTDAAGIVTGSVAYHRCTILSTFSWRERGATSDSFSGSLYMDVYTGKGRGVLRDMAQGFQYALTLDAYGASYLEGLPLE